MKSAYAQSLSLLPYTDNRHMIKDNMYFNCICLLATITISIHTHAVH